MNSFFIGLAACMSRENYKLILQTGVLAVAARAKNPNLSEKNICAPHHSCGKTKAGHS